MKKQLKHIATLRAGIILGILFGLLSIVFVPFLPAFVTRHAADGTIYHAVGSGILAIFGLLLPVFCAVAGFIGGSIAAGIYNFVAKKTGGIEFEV